MQKRWFIIIPIVAFLILAFAFDEVRTPPRDFLIQVVLPVGVATFGAVALAIGASVPQPLHLPVVAIGCVIATISVFFFGHRFFNWIRGWFVKSSMKESGQYPIDTRSSSLGQTPADATTRPSQPKQTTQTKEPAVTETPKEEAKQEQSET